MQRVAGSANANGGEKDPPAQNQVTFGNGPSTDAVPSTPELGGGLDESVFTVRKPVGKAELDRSHVALSSTEVDMEASASILTAFTQGKKSIRSQSFDMTESGTRKGESGDVTKCDDGNSAFCSSGETGHWPQFGPLKMMRRGVPYHNLSVEEKLNILEFLLDELLSIDTMAAEFSQRYDATSRSDFLYGEKSESELKELLDADGDNHDEECGVCREIGEVVCCDGCVAAYHKECVAMYEVEGDLATWFCPECQISDPAAFGPLRGGRKSAVDWFTIADVEKAREVGGEARRPQNATTFGSNVIDVARRIHSSETEFLVVHGFVFGRSQDRDRETLGASSLPLSSLNLQNVLSSMGADIYSRWPFEQVPNEMSPPRYPSTTYNKKYFSAKGAFNPSFYENKYFKAPLPACVRRIKESHLMDYEIRCTSATTRNLSAVLTCDMSNDEAVAESLRTSSALFSTWEMITLFLLRIETDLLKACLLDAFWKTSQTSGTANAWSTAVLECRCVRRLARLLVQLVDATHPKAFLSGWFQTARVKQKEPDRVVRSEAFVSLSDEFNPEDESARRHWERCRMSNIPNLVGNSSKRLVDWISEIRPGFKYTVVRTGKRKQSQENRLDKSSRFGKVALPCSGLRTISAPGFFHRKACPIDVESLQAEPTRGDIACTIDDAENHRQDEIVYYGSQTTSIPRKRRKSDRDHPYYGRNKGALLEATSSSFSYAKLRIDAVVRQKVADLLSAGRAPDAVEAHWPVAGRKLFDPVGYLSKSITRHLGRNAGGYIAPFVAYSSLHEVGQVSYTHLWRKRALLCNSFEELLVLLRALETFLDDGVSQVVV